MSAPDPAQPLVIVGAGGHGREVWNWAEASHPHHLPVGFLDDSPAGEPAARLGADVIGPVSRLGDWEGLYVIAIGSSEVRQRIAASAGPRAVPVALVHPSAVLGGDVEVGAGSQICPASVVTTNVRIGRHCIVNVAGVVSHDCRLGDFVTLSPGSFLNGNVTLGDGVFLGTGAIVCPGVTVGPGAVIGAGAVVLADVAPGATVVGIPAAPTGQPRR